MPTEVIMPQMGESVAEGTVTKWLKQVGERVERDEPLFEISTDKVDAEIPSPAAGVLSKVLVKESETVAVNTVVAVIDGEGAAAEVVRSDKRAGTHIAAPEPSRPAASAAEPSAMSAAAPLPTPPLPALGSRAGIRSSPLVRRMAREHSVDLTVIRGTGLGGRISKKDILAHL